MQKRMASKKRKYEKPKMEREKIHHAFFTCVKGGCDTNIPVNKQIPACGPQA